MHHHFKELKVWQKAMGLVRQIYFATQCLPPEERFGLRGQLCRCAVSIPSNIAEGSGRATPKDFAHFLNMAFSSCYELETQIILCEDLNYMGNPTSQDLQIQIRELQKMLYVFKTRIQSQS